jgi:outer membrane usher protein
MTTAKVRASLFPRPERPLLKPPLSTCALAAVLCCIAVPNVTAQIDPNAAQSPSALPASGSGAPQRDRLIPLDVSINSANVGSWVLLERQGILYAPQDAFESWRLNLRPDAVPVQLRGQNWFSLSAIPGFESQVNLVNQSIALKFSSNAFSATRLANDQAPAPVLTPSIPAFFVNYDLNYNHSAPLGAARSEDVGALTELGFSSDWGVLTSSYVGRNLSSHASSQRANWRRLETSFTRDFPEHKITLRLGDGNTRAGVGARSVYFGGVQITRNFALAPGFITQPLPIISGTASAPSTVELYVNDALRQTSQVPTGPFAIDNFPLISGGGQARVVVRDVLGRETVLVQPFFSSNAMLEQGLSDWSVELGRVRLDLGTLNSNYGQAFASGVWRYGLSKQTTLESAAQFGQDNRTLGLGLTQALPWGTLGYLNVIASDDDQVGRGCEWNAGLEKSSLHHGMSLRVVSASRDFRQLGLQSNTLPNRLEASLNYSYNSSALGSLGLGLARLSTYDRGSVNTLSGNYSVRLGERTTFTLSAARVVGSGNPINQRSSTAVGMSLNIALDRRISFSSAVTHRGKQTDAYTSVSQGLQSDSGVGWRALAGSRDGRGYAEGGLYYQNSKALLSADVSSSSQFQAARFGLQSAWIWADGELFASRRVQDSYAVVEVAGYKDIGIDFQGADRARTDVHGRAFVSGLQPYQSNSVRLNASDLPINAEIENLELMAVPAARSAVKLSFPVRTGRAALIKIVLSDGSMAPAGTEIELVGDRQSFFVARRGEAFITGLQARNELRLKLSTGSCRIQLDLPPVAGEDVLRLGPLTCIGVTP